MAMVDIIFFAAAGVGVIVVWKEGAISIHNNAVMLVLVLVLMLLLQKSAYTKPAKRTLGWRKCSYLHLINIY